MASIRSFFVRHISGFYMKRSKMDTDPLFARRVFQARMTKLPAARGVRHVSEQIDGVDCEWLIPAGCDDAPVIYYLHGGAYIMGLSLIHI